MHALRSSTRRLQRLVWLTLLAWSFALASGVVNACILSLPARTAEGSSPPVHAAAATDGSASRAIGHHGAEDHGPQATSHPHQAPASPERATCLKFCADQASAVAKGTFTGVDMAAAVVDSRVERLLVVAPVPVESGGLPLARPRALRGPPLVIRFLRLNL